MVGALAALVLTSAMAAALARAQTGIGAVQAQLSREMRIAGPGSGAYVYDLSTKQVLFASGAQQRRPPASVEKLYTATAVLDRMGADTHLQTTVLGVGHLGPGGTWIGDLYLRGGGDPTFGSTSFIRSHYDGEGASVSMLVAQLVQHDGIHRVTGSIEGDESYFDSLRGEPSSDYALDPFLEGRLSALAFNRGQTGSMRGPHAPAAYAAHELWGALKRDGVSIAGGASAAPTPVGAVQLAAVDSPTISQLLGLMLPPSDNFFAETLLKDLGARFGAAGTTASGALVVRQTIASLLGIHPQIVDGSGLSRADQTSPYQVVDLLGELAHTPVGATLQDALAVAGRSGTLAERMRDTPAAGRCHAKTGTLTGVSNLAGYCEAENGDLIAFAFLNDDISIEAAHLVQDNMTITLARY
jgi:serine-type D-Ala-D-Ala carboxypeptidase/endopeptidase (penicillin-binding protein 4)